MELSKMMAFRKAAVLAALALSITCVTVAPAAVASPSDGTTGLSTSRTVHVRGEQIPVDAANGTYVMRGDLVGNWLYVPRTPPLHASDTLYVEAGTEVFNGCIDRNGNGRCGRRDYRGELHLAFIYWASYDLEGDLIKGQCVHPVTGGSGAFRGARGVLNMVDTPVGEEVKTSYRGYIVLNAVPSEVAAPAVVTKANPTAEKTTSTTALRKGC
jgi:hypothetical protein